MTVRFQVFIIFIFIICFPIIVIPLAINRANRNTDEIGKMYLKKRYELKKNKIQEEKNDHVNESVHFRKSYIKQVLAYENTNFALLANDNIF